MSEKWREAGTWSVMSFEASFSGSLILPKSPPVRDRPTYQRIATVRTTIKPAPAELRATHLVLSGFGGSCKASEDIDASSKSLYARGSQELVNNVSILHLHTGG